MRIKRLLVVGLSLICLLFPIIAEAWVKGIYVTQPTVENRARLSYLIRQANSVGINTFIIDFHRMSRAYRKNIELVKRNDIKYVARIVVFPGGGNESQVRSKAYWEKKYKLILGAIDLGASEIQLDYIRFSASRRPSSQNAKDIHRIISWYKDKLDQFDIPLQVAVFGETSFGASRSIGQNVKLFADSVDVVCPMLYPSHYEPFRKHAKQPYQTVLSSLNALREQFDNSPPFKVYAYVELSNYRYPLSRQQKLAYIYSQIKATEDGRADGWYAWSPHNQYDNLFRVLKVYSLR